MTDPQTPYHIGEPLIVHYLVAPAGPSTVLPLLVLAFYVGRDQGGMHVVELPLGKQLLRVCDTDIHQPPKGVHMP